MAININPGTGRFNVAIIGGGFSGAVLASRLLDREDAAFSVALIERAPVRARGIAYSTQESCHLLNVPASNMSALGEDPNHFLRWVRSNFDSAARPGDFLPRRLYGQYIESVLGERVRSYPGRLSWRQGEAVALRSGQAGFEIVLHSGDAIEADFVVLALGNFPPADLQIPGKQSGSRCYVSNPWAPDAFSQVPSNGQVLLIGSGLTSVDALLTLRARGFRGTVHMLSRHGLLPQAHVDGLPPAQGQGPAPLGSARGLLRRIRQEIREADKRGLDWRVVIDTLRPSTQALWQSLSHAERRRFLRHLRAYWEVHRHRVAPEIGRVLKHQLVNQQLHVHSGRMVAYTERRERALVTFRERKSGELRQLSADLVVNCSGPASDIRKLNNPLLADCLRQGILTPDPLSLGIHSAADGAVINAAGVSSESLYVIGPLRKGNLWETIAVPEIRVQAADLSALLARKHCSGRKRNAELEETVSYA
jgi:uncharacterized NAD(P)/FAD-binding protein YdhS